MKVFQPQISVVLYKSFPRTELVKGIKANQSRYNRADGMELAVLLGDGGSVHTTKNIRAGMGSFVIRFADRMDKALFDSIAAETEPGDLIEIRAAHGPNMPSSKLPLIMRGFVSDIVRSEGVGQDGKPQRFVELRGNDLQKILSTLRINYKFGSQTNAYSMLQERFLWAYGGENPNLAMSGNEFALLCVERIINKQIEVMRGLAKLDGQETQASASIFNWQLEASIDGTISSTALNGATDISLMDLMSTLLDVDAGFNELWVEDRDNAPPVLILRPTPFKNVQGDFIQPGAWANAVDISSDDVVSMQTSRSDREVANYFWVESPKMANLGIEQRTIALSSAGVGSFTRLTDHNSHEAIHGWRELNVETAMGSNDAVVDFSGLREVELNNEQMVAQDWVKNRRDTLVAINEDNILFESLQLQVRGNPDLKPGIFIGLNRGIQKGSVGTGYCYQVDHSWIPFQGFTTSCRLDRYTGFIVRSQKQSSPYIAEIES